MTETVPVNPTAVPYTDRRTIPRLWHDAMAATRDRPAYLLESAAGWEEMSWQTAGERVDEYANGLLALGIRKGDAVAILARTRVEWALLDLALARIGAIVVPVYASSSGREAAYVLGHSDSVGVVCEDAEQLAKIGAAQESLPALEHVLTFDDLAELAARGRAFGAANPDALSAASGLVDEDDLYTIIYTSGTTGPPKGCMMSHRNYYVMACVGDSMDSYYADDDVMLLYLPLAHNFGRLMLLTGAHVGFTIALLPDPLRVGDALLGVRPTVLPSVPRVYEKIHGSVVVAFEAATGLRRRVLDWALPVGREVSRLESEGRPIPPSLAARHALADRLVFRKVQARLGGRLRIAISGGAPLAKEICEFFDAIGIRIVEGYGLTECTTACSANLPDRYRFGTVGPPLPGFEIELAMDGEILVRSETVFQGYYKDPEATAAVLTPDGWLRTGDVGTIDADGFLTITDRKKNLIVTAGGKNVAPQLIENDLKTSKYVSQALVVGDRRPYVTALITLDPAEIGEWAVAEGVDGDVSSLADDPRVRALVSEVVDDVNAERSRPEQVKRFAILPRDFTMEAGEVTPTLKLRRRACIEHFQAEIDELYAQ